MKALLFIPFFLLSQIVWSQPLQKQWDYRFGGTNYDYLNSFQQTNDGGFILGGYSSSTVSGDKTEPCWGMLDYWIVKIDASGNKQWDKRFGGDDQDVLTSVQQTQDGGYILGGYSSSGVSGDKTQPSRGFNDYWIVKTDSAGNKIWDKRYGGANDELMAVVLQTNDGGYILGGYSGSGISGDKTMANQGSNDYWIIRTDSIGTILWDKDFGGIDYDFLTNLLITPDGGFLLGGASSSPASGDKTQNIWGANDVWLLKTDSMGNKIWDADYGGFDYDQLNSMGSTNDGGFILGCYSSSNISGNKTQNSWGQGDVWLIKIDSSGAIQWDSDLGANDIEDGIGSVFQNPDGTYFVICNSYSGISGDKTQSNLGSAQAWMVKADSSGHKIWDKTILTSPEQKVYPMMVRTADGCYAVAEATYGDVAGDKSQPNRDPTLNSTDFWIIRYCDTTAITTAIFSAENTICPGTCIDFTNLSIYANSFQWFFPGATTTSSTDVQPQGICYPTPGVYDVTLIATGQNGNDTLTLSNYITVYPSPPPQSILQNGDTLFALQGAVTYQWYLDGGIINGATNDFYVATLSGNYNVVATDEHGCEVEAAILNVIAGIQSTVDDRQVTLFPNPAHEIISIRTTSPIPEAAEVCVFNTSGICVMKSTMEEETIDVSALPAGLYILEIKTNQKIFHSRISVIHIQP